MCGARTACSSGARHKPDRVSRDRNIAVAKFYVWNHGGAKLRGRRLRLRQPDPPQLLDSFGGNVAEFWQVQDDRLTRGGPPSLELPAPDSRT